MRVSGFINQLLFTVLSNHKTWYSFENSSWFRYSFGAEPLSKPMLISQQRQTSHYTKAMMSYCSKSPVRTLQIGVRYSACEGSKLEGYDLILSYDNLNNCIDNSPSSLQMKFARNENSVENSYSLPRIWSLQCLHLSPPLCCRGMWKI